MEIELKKLGEITTGNTPSKKDEKYWDSADICFVKPDGIADEGITLISDSSEYISENARGKARVVSKDAVFVTCIGSIGKVGIADYGDYAFNQQINVIEPNEKVLPRYLAYNLLYSKPRLVAIANAPVVPIINKTQFGEFIVNIEEDRTKQAEIISVLDKLTGIIDSRKKELESFDELIKARFVEMFEKESDENVYRLEDISDIVSGITKGRKTKETEFREVPYMAVSNVKDGYIDWTTVKTILATEDEISLYKLLPNDVLMTEGGDPDKLGRGAIITEPPKDCIHQNHIFRVRLDKKRVLPRYFSAYLQSSTAKKYFLKAAKQTTGIASINMTQLRGLPTNVPTLDRQREYAEFCEQVDKSKVIVQKSLDETQILFDSLMQEYFGQAPK
nr:restriction endonuclease subunit S [uncultured Butyrivibrio sp.]